MQKPISVAVYIGALALVMLSVCGPADARTHQHWRHAVFSNFDYGNSLSPCSYVYPEADWRSFFYRVRHYGPIVHLFPHSPCYVYY
jgi:hypothetical protein